MGARPAMHHGHLGRQRRWHEPAPTRWPTGGRFPAATLVPGWNPTGGQHGGADRWPRALPSLCRQRRRQQPDRVCRPRGDRDLAAGGRTVASGAIVRGCLVGSLTPRATTSGLDPGVSSFLTEWPIVRTCSGEWDTCSTSSFWVICVSVTTADRLAACGTRGLSPTCSFTGTTRGHATRSRSLSGRTRATLKR